MLSQALILLMGSQIHTSVTQNAYDSWTAQEKISLDARAVSRTTKSDEKGGKLEKGITGNQADL